MAKRTKDEFTRDWIIENSVEILSRYEPGVLTIRALHYQLVSIGMTNTLQHYKRVVAAMEFARWDGRVDFEAFSDRDRAMCGYTHAEPTNLEDKQDEAKQQVIEWGLPPAPAKETDSRTANWDGLGQVELDAVKPEKLIALLDDAINEIFDQDLYDELIATEAKERELFQAELKRYVEEDL